MNIVSKLSLILLIMIIGCNDTGRQESLSVREINKVKLTDLNNYTVDLKIYRGKTIFINFWATWCKPCLQEMPSIQRAMEKLKGEGVVFLFASDETVEQIENFKNQNKYPFLYVRVENLEELNVMGLPTTFIFNADNKLVFSEIGAREWDDQANIDLIKKIAVQK